MDVGFLTGSVSRESGGVFDAVKGLAQALSGKGDVRIRVLGLLDKSTERDRHYWGELKVEVFPCVGPANFGYAPWMRACLQDLSLDLLHTHGLWMYKSVLAHGWAARHRKRYLVTPHGMLDAWALRHSRIKKCLAGLLFEKAHLRGAACVHALCGAEAAAIRDFGLDNPVCVLPNAIDVARPSTAGAPGCLPSGEDRKMLLYLGRIHPKKGLANLVRGWSVASRASSAAREWILALAGWDQGGHESELKALVQELALTDSVRFLGPRFDEAKAAAYQHCSAFILPSFSEGLPMVVLEAWGYSKPVLMTPHCNLPEGFEAGAAIPIKTDPESIARGLEVLFGLGDSERADIGRRGLTLVEAKFSWPVIAREMRKVYEWVLGGGPKPSCVEAR